MSDGVFYLPTQLPVQVILIQCAVILNCSAKGFGPDLF